MRKGFTLIELLIVVSIIGILAVSLMPNITGSQQKARDAARLAAVKDAVTAIEEYAIDNNGYPAANSCVNPTLFADYYSKPGVPKVDAVTTDLCFGATTVTYPYYKKLTDGYVIFIPVETVKKANSTYGSVASATGLLAPLVTTRAQARAVPVANAYAIIR